MMIPFNCSYRNKNDPYYDRGVCHIDPNTRVQISSTFWCAYSASSYLPWAISLYESATPCAPSLLAVVMLSLGKIQEPGDGEEAMCKAKWRFKARRREQGNLHLEETLEM
jgi:hypothetical protein